MLEFYEDQVRKMTCLERVDVVRDIKVVRIIETFGLSRSKEVSGLGSCTLRK